MSRPEHWQIAPATPMALHMHEIHVWRASLEQPEAVFRKLQATLSADEFARASRFQFEQHRRRFVVARGVLRDILGRYLGVAANVITFEYETHGKPKLAKAKHPENFCFNLSHAKELALCAITRGHALGVDVEHIHPISDAEQIARRFFSEREAGQFCALPQEQKQIAFFNCWTRKEAFIKALGEGLSHPLDRFEVAFLPGELAALLQTRPDPQEAERWSMFAFEPAADYAGALVVAGKDFALKYWQWQGHGFD